MCKIERVCLKLWKRINHTQFIIQQHTSASLMEDNPEEAVHNNILGTKNTAEAAKNAEVKKFVMIATE